MAAFLKSPERRYHTRVSRVRYARTRASRGIRNMASPIKHVLLLTEYSRQNINSMV